MKAPEVPALTGLRFFAASLVFLQHLTTIPGMGWMNASPVFGLGTYGVAIFFVLSGFILTYNYAPVFSGGITALQYGQFVWDRLSRIYPLYLLTLLLCIPIQYAAQNRIWSWPALGLHLTLTQCIVPVHQLRLTDYFNIPGWSISCEMLFYILAPFLIWWSISIRTSLKCLLLAAITSLFILGSLKIGVENFPWPARFAPLRVPEFAMGVMGGAVYLKARRLSSKTTFLLLVSGTGLLALAIGCDALAPVVVRAGPLCAPGAVLLIFGLAQQQGRVAQLLSHRWIELLGMSSFAFYLIHDPAIRLCKGLCQHYGFSFSRTWFAAMFGAVLFVLLQVISIFLFKKFEMPIQKFLRQLIRPPRAETFATPAPSPANAPRSPTSV